MNFYKSLEYKKILQKQSFLFIFLLRSSHIKPV